MMFRMTLLAAIMLASAAVLAAPVGWYGMGLQSYVDPAGHRFLHVENVTKGGPADRANIQPGDVITAIDHASIQHSDDLDVLTYLSERNPSSKVTLRTVRNGKPNERVITVGRLTPQAREAWDRALAAARTRRLRYVATPQP